MNFEGLTEVIRWWNIKQIFLGGEGRNNYYIKFKNRSSRLRS